MINTNLTNPKANPKYINNKNTTYNQNRKLLKIRNSK